MRAPCEFQQVGLLLAFNSLRHDVEPRRLGDKHHALSHRQGVDAFAHFPANRPIELERVELKLTYIRDAGRADAEIIQNQPDSPCL